MNNSAKAAIGIAAIAGIIYELNQRRKAKQMIEQGYMPMADHTGKTLLGVAVAGSAYIAWRQYDLIKNVQRHLNAQVDGRLVKIDKNGIQIALTATLKNPSKGKITIRHPYLRCTYNGSFIADSRMQDKFYSLEPYQQVTIPDIELAIPAKGLFTLGSALYDAFIRNAKVSLQGELRTEIITPIIKVPFSLTQTIPIKY
jgi:hypothetical protein